MVKIILHISDIHIRTFQLHDLYREQLKKFIIDASEKVTGYLHDEIRIVITGDIVDQKINISNELVILTSWFFREISKIGKVVIIPGNHDFLVNNQDRLDSISPIVKILDNENIVFYKDSGVYADENIKWVVYSLFQDNKKPVYKKEDGFYIGLFHGPIQGMATDIGFKFEDGYDTLNFLDLDLLLCGDIHKRQVIDLPQKRKGYMIGSFLQKDFAETIKHHGYGIYDVETDEYKFVDIESEQPYMHFRINDITDIEDGKEILLNLG